MAEVRNQRVTVLGLGRFGGGIAVCRWLAREGAASITVVDAEPANKLADSVAQLAGLPIEFHLGPTQQQDADFTAANLIVASPAVPPASPQLALARAAGVPITTEICLYVERCRASFVGVTGTKGKSTTTALLGRMLGTKCKTWVGGNIGISLLAELPNIAAGDIVVLELSSYMLHYLGQRRWSPHVAVVTMLAVDHLDWHGSAEAYLDAKRNLVRHQRAGDIAVLNADDPAAARFAADTPAAVTWFSLRGSRAFRLALAGDHNQLNAQAAFAAASALGVDWESAQFAVADFAGLPHRLQLVHEHDGIRYVNDSIATIPQAAAAALRSFPPGLVIQIVGGSAKKNLPIDQLCAALSQRAKAVICIGQTGPTMASTLASQHRAGILPIEVCADLPAAVTKARALARPGDIILLSPGAPSYDQFPNFEKRGEQFSELAKR
jgi:UDP-N-acetylmuramoylalanine--D-glutamate ligase